LHYFEGFFSLGEEGWVAVEIGEVEEEWFEEGLFDDALELFEALSWFFEALLSALVLIQVSVD